MRRAAAVPLLVGLAAAVAAPPAAAFGGRAHQQVPAEAELGIDVYDGAFFPGVPGLFIVVLDNDATTPARTPTITVTLPPWLRPTGGGALDAQGRGWRCGASGQRVTCASSIDLAGADEGEDSQQTIVGIRAVCQLAGDPAADPPIVTAEVTGSASSVSDPDGADEGRTGTFTCGGATQTPTAPVGATPGSADVAIDEILTSYFPGQDSTVLVVVRNLGPGTATAPRVSAELGDALRVKSVTAVDGWTCSANELVVDCARSTALAPPRAGDNARESVFALTVECVPGGAGEVDPDDGEPPLDDVVSTWTISTTATDPDVTNNEAFPNDTCGGDGTVPVAFSLRVAGDTTTTTTTSSTTTTTTLTPTTTGAGAVQGAGAGATEDGSTRTGQLPATGSASGGVALPLGSALVAFGAALLLVTRRRDAPAR